MGSGPIILNSLNDYHQVYQEYNLVVRRVIFRIVGNQYVDDMVQECFIRAWKSKDQFNGQSSLKTWLCRIAVNVSIDMKRQLKVRENTVNAENLEIYSQSPDDDRMKDLIQESIDQLKDDYKAAFVLVAIEGFSTKETAEILKIDEGTVRSRVSRARAQARSYLNERGINYGK